MEFILEGSQKVCLVSEPQKKLLIPPAILAEGFPEAITVWEILNEIPANGMPKIFFLLKISKKNLSKSSAQREALVEYLEEKP